MAMPGTASAPSTAAREPAVIGYPNQKGVTIERVTYPARNRAPSHLGEARREGMGERGGADPPR